MATTRNSYAIISLGGKQYRVREGERLLVDRLETDEGKTFHPNVLFVGGDGEATLAPRTQVTAKVVGHVLGEKIRIGKRRPKTGYRRQTGFRAKLSQIEIQAIGGSSRATTERKAAPSPRKNSRPRPRRRSCRAATPTSRLPTSRRSRSAGTWSNWERR